MPTYNNKVVRGNAGQGHGDRHNSSAVWCGGRCVCPRCSYMAPSVKGQACNQRVCPVCGAKMTAALFML